MQRKTLRRKTVKRKTPRRNPSTVADLIAKQLGGTDRLQSMIGAKNMSYSADSFQFKFPGSAIANYVEIKLLPSDLYKVTFYKIRGLNAPIVKEVSGVDASQLKDLFEQTTKLYLSLGTMRANGAKKNPRRLTIETLRKKAITFYIDQGGLNYWSVYDSNHEFPTEHLRSKREAVDLIRLHRTSLKKDLPGIKCKTVEIR